MRVSPLAGIFILAPLLGSCAPTESMEAKAPVRPAPAWVRGINLSTKSVNVDTARMLVLRNSTFGDTSVFTPHSPGTTDLKIEPKMVSAPSKLEMNPGDIVSVIVTEKGVVIGQIENRTASAESGVAGVYLFDGKKLSHISSERIKVTGAYQTIAKGQGTIIDGNGEGVITISGLPKPLTVDINLAKTVTYSLIIFEPNLNSERFLMLQNSISRDAQAQSTTPGG